jgi:hypothetical protein
MKILCGLGISTAIKNTDLFKHNRLENEDKRLHQYINGIKSFLKLNEIYINNKLIDVYIIDNTIPSHLNIHPLLLDIIPDHIKIITGNINNYGCYNKGAGIIEQWTHCKDFINKYDWFIHFEPRQLLLNNSFIDNFINNPRNLFTYGSNKNHFNTGLFTIKTAQLMMFITSYSPKKVMENKLGLEYILFEFIKNNNITFEILKRMNLIWYDSYAQKEYYW